MPNPLDRKDFIKATANMSSCLAFGLSEEVSVASPDVGPFRPRTALDWLIAYCVQPMITEDSFEQRFESFHTTLDVVEYQFRHDETLKVSRIDLSTFGLLFKQGDPRNPEPREPMRHLFIAAAFRQSDLMHKGGFCNANSLKDYDQFLSTEVQRLGPGLVSEKLEEALQQVDTHSTGATHHEGLDYSMLANSVRTLKDHGIPLGPHAQQVLWKDEEAENAIPSVLVRQLD